LPVALNRADRRLLMWAGGLLAIVIGIALVIASGSGDRGEVTTTYSAGSAGAKAAYLLLEESGYNVARWEEPPSTLTDASSTTLIFAEPLELPTEDDISAVRRFVEAGGHVIATGPTSAWIVGGTAMPEPLGGYTWTTVRSIALSPITRVAPEITLFDRAHWVPGDRAELPLYGEPHAPSVVMIAMGRGEALWWASATPLTNAGITQSNNLQFFLASIGAPAGRRVLWDEYFHGRRPTLAASMWHSPVKWITLQLALVALVVVWSRSRRSGPMIAPPVESRLAPLEFVRTLGSLYRNAGAAGVAVDAATRRVRAGLARRFGISVRTPASDLAEIIGRRSGRDASALGETLGECDTVRDGERVSDAQALALVKALGDETTALQLFGSTREGA
jgi:hypothetical protein